MDHKNKEEMNKLVEETTINLIDKDITICREMQLGVFIITLPVLNTHEYQLYSNDNGKWIECPMTDVTDQPAFLMCWANYYKLVQPHKKWELYLYPKRGFNTFKE